MRNEVRHSVSPHVAVRSGGLGGTGRRTLQRISDETVFDVLTVNRAMGMPGAILRTEAGGLGDLLGGQHKINPVRIGGQCAARQCPCYDILNRGVAQRGALAASIRGGGGKATCPLTAALVES